MVDETNRSKRRAVHGTYRPEPWHPPSKKQTTMLERLIRRFNQLLKRGQKHEVKLSGRITELQKEADRVLDDVVELRKRLGGNVPLQLYENICGILDPIAKQITSLRRTMETNQSTTQQVKTYNRLVDWIDKGAFWIALGKEEDQQKLADAVIREIAVEFHKRIERDVQLVQDYVNHASETIILPEMEIGELKRHVIRQIASVLNQLSALKETPPDLSLEELSKWKQQADEDREKCFSDALHTIDTFFSKYQPSKDIEHSEQTLHMLSQLIDLEEKIEKTVEMIVKEKKHHPSQTASLSAALAKLEEEAHLLNANLSLSHEHSHRVQKSIETIVFLRQSLSAF